MMTETLIKAMHIFLSLNPFYIKRFFSQTSLFPSNQLSISTIFQGFKNIFSWPFLMSQGTEASNKIYYCITYDQIRCKGMEEITTYLMF